MNLKALFLLDDFCVKNEIEYTVTGTTALYRYSIGIFSS